MILLGAAACCEDKLWIIFWKWNEILIGTIRSTRLYVTVFDWHVHRCDLRCISSVLYYHPSEVQSNGIWCDRQRPGSKAPLLKKWSSTSFLSLFRVVQWVEQDHGHDIDVSKGQNTKLPHPKSAWCQLHRPLVPYCRVAANLPRWRGKSFCCGEIRPKEGLVTCLVYRLTKRHSCSHWFPGFLTREMLLHDLRSWVQGGDEKKDLGRPQYLSRTMKISDCIKSLVISASLSVRLAHGDDFDDAINGFMDAQYILGTSVAFHEVRPVDLTKLFCHW